MMEAGGGGGRDERVPQWGVQETRELIDHCRGRLAAFKVPETVYVLDAIPRTPTGKVQRKRVGALLVEQDG